MAQYLPSEQYTISYWLSQQTDFSRFRASEKLPTEVDTLIIGSGYAGTSVAYHLLQEDPAANVMMLEARNLCTGATGRNGGHVKPYIHRYYRRYSAMVGEEKTAQIINSELEHLWALKRIAEVEGIDCDFVLTRACDVYPSKNDPRLLSDMLDYDMMMKSPFVSEDLKKQVQVLYGDAARITSKNPHTEVAITYPAASCWPWKLITGLLKKCVARGLQLHANTPVVEVKKTASGKWAVKTKDRGTVLANKVVFATNGYTKALLPEFDDVISPQRSIICRIAPKDKSNVPHLTNTYGIFTSNKDSDYLINRPDGSVVVGGHDDVMIDFSKKGLAAVSGHFDYADDSEINSNMEAVFNESYMANNFSTWASTPTEVTHKWSGILGYTNDYLPYVGELDVIGKPGAYICAGFHGHGMPRVLFSGRAVAKAIAQGKKVEELEYTCPQAYFVSKERMAKSNAHKEELLKYVAKKAKAATHL